MTDVPELSKTIQSVSSFLGLQLALITLFTSELARRLADEHSRIGGPREGSVKAVKRSAWILFAVTSAAVLIQAPLVWQAFSTCCTGSYRPILWSFVLVWVLLVPLLLWQSSIAWNSRN